MANQQFRFTRIPYQGRQVAWETLDGVRHEAGATVGCREGRPGSGGYICCVLLPDRTVKLEAISGAEYGNLYDPYNVYRIAVEGPHYIVATFNATEQVLSDLKVFFGKHQVNAETHTEARAADSNAGWRFVHGLPYPVTDQVRITWKTDRGKQHEAMLDTKQKLPGDLNRVCIVIVIDDQPRLAAIPWSRRPRWWMDTQP